MGTSQSKTNDPLQLELEVEQSRNSVGSLTQLLELDLYSNQLHHIPDTISGLINLRKIDLGHNNIREFPIVLTELPCLAAIYIQGNSLTDVPMSIEKLSGSLRTLNLSDNNIDEIPQCLKLLTLLGVRDGSTLPAFGVLLGGNHFALPAKRHSWLTHNQLCLYLDTGFTDDDDDGSSELHDILLSNVHEDISMMRSRGL